MKTLITAFLLLVATTAFAGDAYKDKVLGVDAPIRRALAVTPSDTVPLADVPRALYVGGTGDLTVILAEDTTSTVFVAAGGMVPIMVKQILATGTTATSILALY